MNLDGVPSPRVAPQLKKIKISLSGHLDDENVRHLSATLLDLFDQGYVVEIQCGLDIFSERPSGEYPTRSVPPPNYYKNKNQGPDMWSKTNTYDYPSKNYKVVPDGPFTGNTA